MSLKGPSGFEDKHTEEFIEEIFTGLLESYVLAREQLGKCAERIKRMYNIRVRQAKFSVGIWDGSLTLDVILVDRRTGTEITQSRF